MKPRRKIPPLELALEKHCMFQFVMTHVVREEGKRIHMKEIFASYKKWLIAQGCKPSQLTLDGFGRMFPKGFERKHFMRNNRLGKGIEGATLHGI